MGRGYQSPSRIMGGCRSGWAANAVCPKRLKFRRGTNVRCLPSAGMMDGDRRCPSRLGRDCRARGTKVRCEWLQGAGGVPKDRTCRGYQIRAARAVARGAKGVPKSEIADASQFRRPGHYRCMQLFQCSRARHESFGTSLRGAPGVPKSDVFQRLDRGGVPKSEPPTIFRSQLYSEESYIND
jgi:hypothetical protein